MSFYCYFIFIYKIYVPNLGRLLVFILVECGDPLQVTLKSMYRRLIMIFHFGKSKSLLSISSSPVHQQTIVPMAEQYLLWSCDVPFTSSSTPMFPGSRGTISR